MKDAASRSAMCPQPHAPRCVGGLGVVLLLANLVALAAGAVAERSLLTRRLGSRPSCLQSTGGSCKLSSCDSWRQASCSSLLCKCSDGMCSGGNGQCYSKANQRIPGVYKIVNRRWSEYRIASSWSESNMKTKTEAGEDTEFLLYQTPDNGLLVESNKYPGWAMSTATKGLARVDSTVLRELSPTVSADAEAGEVVFKPKIAPEQGRANTTFVMLATIDENDDYICLESTNWDVKHCDGDHGAGAYWRFDPEPPWPAGMLVKIPGQGAANGAARRGLGLGAAVAAVAGALHSGRR